MKSQEQKMEFVKLRAEGKSYSVIANTLHISKGTCTTWEKELKDAIATLKQEQLDELYNAYYMTKEARIKKLGDTLKKINVALDEADFSQIQPEKLLEYKLKYTETLKAEYTGSGAPYQFVANKIEHTDIVTALGDLLNRVRTGEVNSEQANRESMIISNLLKAYNATNQDQTGEVLGILKNYIG